MKGEPREVARIVLTGVAAVASGLLVFASFPPRHLWFLAPVGIALLVAVLLGFGREEPSTKKSGFGYGFLAGLGFFVP
ncbi:MAG: apolipoprotein N-acyltransferase, partial [Rhodococcus sp. (in: high G+C Gram-positive bacteria)]